MKKILIIFGGNSYEHDISCLSAKTIIKNIDKNKYQIEIVGIDKYNNWFVYNDNIDLLTKDWPKLNTTKINNIVSYLKQFDKVFPIIHGSPFEDGKLQALFNLFNISYVGSNTLSSIISYDKALTKIICEKYGIPQIPYIILNNNNIKHLNISYPVIIKPAKCGSSIGINIANSKKELNIYIKEAFKYDDKVIIEKYIKTRELECAILKTNKIIISPIGEIKSANIFYDYDAKYQKESKLLIPAPISKNLAKQIKILSKKIFNILELSTISRIDFLYDYINDKLYFNEVNTMPGFTSISMYPLLFQNMNINIQELITKLIES